MILEKAEDGVDGVDAESKENGGAEALSVKVIDYDYVGYNFRAFEFGNFFNELMIDNYYEDPPYFKIDEADYPSKEYRRRFVTEYMKGINDEEEGVEEKAVVDAVMAIEYGCLLSHFWWAMWGIVESDGPGQGSEWDYLEYARQRLLNYFIKKQAIGKAAAKE